MSRIRIFTLVLLAVYVGSNTHKYKFLKYDLYKNVVDFRHVIENTNFWNLFNNNISTLKKKQH